MITKSKVLGLILACSSVAAHAEGYLIDTSMKIVRCMPMKSSAKQFADSIPDIYRGALVRTARMETAAGVRYTIDVQPRGYAEEVYVATDTLQACEQARDQIAN